MANGRALETAPLLDILRWAVDAFNTRVTFTTGFGADRCVPIDLIGRHHLLIDVFTLDTNFLFPETYSLWSQLEDRYGPTIRGARLAFTVEEQNRVHGHELWTGNPNRCRNIRKMIPLTAERSRFDAWIAATRRDQTLHRVNALAVEWDQEFDLSKVNPLVRWTKREVWSHLLTHEVPYNPLYGRGLSSVKCYPCTNVPTVSGTAWTTAPRTSVVYTPLSPRWKR